MKAEDSAAKEQTGIDGKHTYQDSFVGVQQQLPTNLTLFFGIQHYGECWSSADAASRFHIYGQNKNCINAEFKSCNNLVREEACAGVNWTNYVYEIVPQSADGGSGVGGPVHPDEY